MSLAKLKLYLCSLLVLFAVVNAAADSQRVRSLKLFVDLEKDGTATIYERWDVNTGDDITEWYLVRENLDDIVIDSLEVAVDEVPCLDDGEWDVHRTLEQKAGKSGIVHKSNGVELCWGIGSHGDHIFEALYKMHGAVKSLNDYDMLFLQLVSPGLSAPPENVRIFIASDHVQLDTTVARVWGFGYDGICIFEHGKVVVENDYAFGTDDSVIVLLRLDKGIFEPTSVQRKDFDEVLAGAMIGADFGNWEPDEEVDDIYGFAALGIFTVIGIVWWRIRKWWKTRKQKPAYKIKKLLGMKEQDILWYRDIPFKGNLPTAKYVMGLFDESNLWDAVPLTSALILRMVYNGYLEVSRELEKKDTEIRFTDKDLGGLDNLSRRLYDMLKKAAGENEVLEKNEFESWAKTNHATVYEWSTSARNEGQNLMQANGWSGSSSQTLSPAGQEEAKHLLGLKKFLQEFTLTKEREAFEAGLWKEYLVYGAVLGVAERVARQLKEIAPQYGNVNTVLDMSTSFSRVVRTATALHVSKSYTYSSGSSSYSSRSSHSYSSSHSRSGHGGRSSHSGGHGHSSGGRGGGGR